MIHYRMCGGRLWVLQSVYHWPANNRPEKFAHWRSDEGEDWFEQLTEKGNLKPDVACLKAELTQQVTWDMKNKATALVQECVVGWIKENVLPEIVASLVQSKDGLVGLGKSIGPAIVNEISAAVIAQVSENLKQSWTRKKLFDALLE